MTTDEIRQLFDAPPPRAFPFRRYVLAAFALGVVGAIVAVAFVARNDGDPLAELRVRGKQVSVHRADSTSELATEGADLQEGDTIRTDADGQAQIDLFDGSIVRLDRSTETVLRDLTDESGGSLVTVDLESGRTWNRVSERTSSGGAFEVEMPSGTARARGTIFVTDCRRGPSCYVIGVDGSTQVSSDAGSRSTAGAGDCIEIKNDRLEVCDAGKLGLTDDWFTENLAVDQRLTLKKVVVPTPSPTPATPSPTIRRIEPVRPAPPPPPPTAQPTPAPTPPPTERPEPTPVREPRRTAPPAPTSTDD